MKRSKGSTNLHTDAVCTECKEPVNIEFPVRSNTWAYGMVGVRMMLCSKPCQETYDTKERVA